MTDEPTAVADEGCSSNVQRVGRKDVVKSSRMATAVKEVEGKPALEGIQILSGGFITERGGKHCDMCPVLILLVKVPTTETFHFFGIGDNSPIPPEKSEPSLLVVCLFHT